MNDIIRPGYCGNYKILVLISFSVSIFYNWHRPHCYRLLLSDLESCKFAILAQMPLQFKQAKE